MKPLIISIFLLALGLPVAARAQEGQLSPAMQDYMTPVMKRAFQFTQGNKATLLDAKSDFTTVGWYLFTEYLKSLHYIDANDVPLVNLGFNILGSFDIYPMHRMDIGLRGYGGMSSSGGTNAESYGAYVFIGLKLDKSSNSTNPRYLIHKLVISDKPDM